MKSWTGWAAAALAIATLLATNAGNISKILGLGAQLSETQRQQERLSIFARGSEVIWTDLTEDGAAIVYVIQSHPCTDYTVRYVINGVNLDSTTNTADICDLKPELKGTVTTVREIEIPKELIKVRYTTVQGELIQIDTISIVIQWEFTFSDGTIGYHNMYASVPLPEEDNL